MATQPRLLFYIQHLLGIGHIKRAATLTRGFVAGGYDVTFVSGGMTVPGVDVGGARFVQLPPTRATDIYFKQLVDEHDQPISDAWKAARARIFSDLVDAVQPDVFVTELFPFGRRQLSFELMPVLERLRAAAKPPLVVSSVRDILVESPKPERTREMLDRVEGLYDLVLVHGDPALIPFEETFPHARDIGAKLHYTGYVVDRPASVAEAKREEVIVSAGGGAVSEPLLNAALAARSRCCLRDARWRFLVGHNLPEARFRAFAAQAEKSVIVERARADFTELLRGALLSISQGGYNTVMEVLDAGARAVVVPYAGGLETEQTLRAKLLAERGALHVVEESALSAEALGAAVNAAMGGSPAVEIGLDTSGVETSLRVIGEALELRRTRA